MLDKNDPPVPLGFIGALQILFIGLKLCGVIDWHWGLVLMPKILHVMLLMFLGALNLLIAALENSAKEKR